MNFNSKEEIRTIFENKFRLLREPITELGGFIAGGACLNTLTNSNVYRSDIDIYFPIQYPIKTLIQTFGKYIPGFMYKSKIVNDNIIYISVEENLTSPVTHYNVTTLHIIRSHYGPMEDVVSKFDFSVCQLGYDFTNVFIGDRTIEDIKSNTLRLVNFTDPEKIYLRIIKYETYKGFTPTEHTKFIKEFFAPLPKNYDNSYS